MGSTLVMRKIKLVCLIWITLIFFLVAVFSQGIKTPKLLTNEQFIIPDNYYNSVCIIPWWMPVKIWLEAQPWQEPYKHGGWDCSQMSAFTEWALENCGYYTEIVIGLNHAWVVVDIQGTIYWYECTNREIRPAGYFPDTYIAFGNIYDILRQYCMGELSRKYAIKSFEREWGWWKE